MENRTFLIDHYEGMKEQIEGLDALFNEGWNFKDSFGVMDSEVIILERSSFGDDDVGCASQDKPILPDDELVNMDIWHAIKGDEEGWQDKKIFYVESTPPGVWDHDQDMLESRPAGGEYFCGR